MIMNDIDCELGKVWIVIRKMSMMDYEKYEWELEKVLVVD